MADRREQILARLLEIARAAPGIVLTERNKPELSERSRPAVLIMDADEAADDREKGRGRPPHAPNLIGLTPEIYILLGASERDVGSRLNALRALLVKAILMDADLRQIVGPNGDIRYEGCATDLAVGRSVEGAMGLNITFSYVLNPAEL